MTGRRRKAARVLETVRGYRASRTIPTDLFGGDDQDEALAQITDGLDKVFAMLDLSEYRGVAAPAVVRRLNMELVARRTVCVDENVVEFTFRRVDGEDVPAWHPGCHVDVELPSGRRRQYSLCGDPLESDAYTVAVRLIPDGGGGSREMHSLDVGDRIVITGPRNAFPFVAAGSALFVAGGIGITAILPMVRRARAVGMDWHLVHTGRSRQATPYLDEISTWEPERVTVRSDDVDGLPTAADLLRHAPEGGSVYTCGPPAMMDLVRQGISETGATRLHLERFSPPPVVAGEPFKVTLARSEETVEVPADRTALDVLREQRPSIPYSCRQGFCGTCRVRVLEGTPEHRDRRLSPAEREDHMLICVSRAEGDSLVLDL
ncbi:PDR/VanB family oxidoreductase [Rhodococcoides corynebacterioides]|uniref:PDR/VanB family oxidoreductase n=1 Tax=Rhodococcoides corynebacterioides TaxID=53972 RepID=UPI003F807D58